MTDEQPDIPEAYADLVALLTDSNNGAVMDDQRVRPLHPRHDQRRLRLASRGDPAP